MGATVHPRPRRAASAAGGPAQAFALLLALASTPAFGSPMKTPDIKQNPRPQQRYELTLSIDGAPGPFDSITGTVHYKVQNERCVPATPGSGATLTPERNVPIEFVRINDHEYKGTLFVDLLQDEDYYGMGVCHWAVNTAWATLKIKGVEFSPAMDSRELLAQKPVPTYFVRSEYFNSSDERTAFGTPNRALFKPTTRTDIFSMTLTARETGP